MASRAESFSLGPLTTYADPAAMAAWIADARPGSVLIYACGPYLAEHPARAMARRWQEAGEAELFQARSERAHCFDYKARKILAAARADAAAQVACGARSRWRLHPDALRMLVLLEELAGTRAPCPSNAALAAELTLGGAEQGRYRFNQLVSEGFVRVIEPARFGARVIELVETGARTAAQAADPVGGRSAGQASETRRGQ